MKRPLLCLLLAALLTAPATAADWGPWEAPGASGKPRTSPGTDHPGLLRGGIRFFQKFISPVDGPRCPMTPTCSAYALQTLGKHGPAIGTMMTVDRLFRESDKREHRHPVRYPDRIRYRDPIENNDFWFAEK